MCIIVAFILTICWRKRRSQTADINVAKIESGVQHNVLGNWNKTSRRSMHISTYNKPYFGAQTWGILNDTSDCDLPSNMQCTYSDGPDKANISHAIIFKGELVGEAMPAYRPPGQQWIFYEMESPVFIRKKVNVDWKKIRYIFNYTITYSTKSDLTIPYGGCRSVDTRLKMINYFEKKTRLAAWFVSHCQTQSKREKYVTELMKYMPVDVYGECGNYSCPVDDSKDVVRPTECELAVINNSKFYLGFENALCEEYITEKCFVYMRFNSIVVVYGSGQYQKLLPPNSFINARDYKSPAALAMDLLAIANDEQRYNSFFHWKTFYQCGYHMAPLNLCDVCRLLHEQEKTGEKKIVDIDEFWSVDRMCSEPIV